MRFKRVLLTLTQNVEEHNSFVSLTVEDTLLFATGLSFLNWSLSSRYDAS